MSLGPTVSGVAGLRDLAVRYQSLGEELTTLDGEIKSRQKRLQTVQGDYEETRGRIIKQLESMDCDSRGNTGWEYRVAMMLAELTRVSKGG